MIAIRSRNIITQGHFFDGAVLVEDEHIIGVVPERFIPKDCTVEDYGSLLVLPGLVDTHVHINEPGRTEWEGFTTATMAAAAGGITTVADMPLNCIPVTTSLAALKTKLEQLNGKLWVDCAFHGGIIPGNRDELAAMMRAGVRTFKAFMIDSGIPEFPAVSKQDLLEAMQFLAQNQGVLLAHAEVELAHANHTMKSPSSYADYLASRPTQWENAAIKTLIELSESTRCRTHVVHLSSSEAVRDLRQAHLRHVPITAETCPHYLLLAAEDIPDGDARFKCAPPIRDRSNRDQLWTALLCGDVEFVVSDHSPCSPHLKHLESHNLRDAWGGISSLQLGLPLMWTELKRRSLPATWIAQLMSERPARLIGRHLQKGRIATGYDADLVIFDPEQKQTISESSIYHRHKKTPYEGREVYGRVEVTYLRGQKIYFQNRFTEFALGRKLL